MNMIVAKNFKDGMTKTALNSETAVIEVKSNVARDALKRASDFPDVVTAIFEAIANAYESYNVGQRAKVWIEIFTEKKTTVVKVRDEGVGMCSAIGLTKFFSLHLKTERRHNGLNMRGYNGTGKVAGFKYAETMQIESVKNGLRNIIKLEYATLKRCADEYSPPYATFVIHDEQTDAPSGTTFMMSGLHRDVKITDEVMDRLRQKIAVEQMMWMRDAEIMLNGELIAPAEVHCEERFEFEEGDFKGTVYVDLNRPYEDELPAAYISAGRVFMAREQFGMEGRRFRMNTHGSFTTTEDWAAKHFYDHREKFVSESRDLKLKVNNNPQAQAYAEFVRKCMTTVLDKLDDDYEKKRQADYDKELSAWERFMSKMLNIIIDGIGGTEGRKAPDPNRVIISRKGNESGESNSDDDGKGKNRRLAFEYDRFPVNVPYQMDVDSGRIRINSDYPVIKSVSGDVTSSAFRLATVVVAKDAVIDLMAQREIAKAMEARDIDAMEAMKIFQSIQAATSEQFSKHETLLFQECHNAMKLADKA